MYKEFVKHDEDTMETLKNALVNSEEPEVPLRLGEFSGPLAQHGVGGGESAPIPTSMDRVLNSSGLGKNGMMQRREQWPDGGENGTPIITSKSPQGGVSSQEIERIIRAVILE